MHKIMIGLIIDMNVWQETRKQFKIFFYNLLSSREMVRDMPSFQKKNLNGSFKVEPFFQKGFYHN